MVINFQNDKTKPFIDLKVSGHKQKKVQRSHLMIIS